MIFVSGNIARTNPSGSNSGSSGSAAAGAAPDGWLAYYSSLAASLTGLSDESLSLVGHSAFRASPAYVAANTSIDYSFASRAGGTVAQQAGGALRILSGVTQQGGIVRLGLNGAIAPNQAAKKFLMVFQYRLTVQPNANSRIYFMTGNPGACECGAGINAPSGGTAKWGFSVNARDGGAVPLCNVLSTQAPVVGQTTTGLLWYDGRFILGSFNGESPITVANTSKMLAQPTTDFFFDVFPAANGQADPTDLIRGAMWAETP